METELILLGKNYYDMDGNKGASVLVYGDHEVTNNSAGVSISNASIDFEVHPLLTQFPATYLANIGFVARKNRSGKEITTVKLSNIEFKENLEFISL